MPGLPPPNKDIADLTAVLGPDNVRTLIRTFLEEYPKLIRQLNPADRKTSQRVVHSLKSTARVMGAHAISARLAELERRLGSETGADLSADEIKQIAADFESAAVPLRAFAHQA